MNISQSSSRVTIANLQPTDNVFFNAQTIALGAILISIWAFRFIYNFRTARQDARAIILAFCVLKKSAFLSHAHDLASQWQVRPYLLAGSCIPALVAWCAWRTLRSDHSRSKNGNGQDKTMFLKPLMIPCRTTHSRFFPTKHSFSYSYLYVGIPIGWRGATGSILSADSAENRSKTGKTWFSVEAEDYLERGIHEHGLQGKLDDYLASQEVSSDQYPYAYLVTAPRFLGFSFNPVSFWYLYNGSKALTAMILEVNNTFDERRMYFMQRKTDSDASEHLDVKFSQEWPKDFHVSPFNDRGGAYSVQSTDPFHFSANDLHKVDNNIVLKSEAGKPKIVARVFSTEPAMDARNMTTWDTFSFVVRWWWVGFMTNPRILKEARTLWAKKLQVYFRPEVFSSSIGRNETLDEVKLEVLFQTLLYQLACFTHVSFHYVAAAGPSRAKQITIRSTWACDENTLYPEIGIRVLTPAFYGELVRSRTLLEAFDRHCFQAADGEAMVDCTHPETLRGSLTTFSASLQEGVGSTVDWYDVANSGQFLKLQPLWQNLIMFMRSDKKPRSRTSPSDFDVCVLRSSSKVSIRPYYRIALKMLLADRIAFGWLPILKLEETCVWLMLVLVAASSLGDLAGYASCGFQGGLLTILKLCGVHLWSCLLG